MTIGFQSFIASSRSPHDFHRDDPGRYAHNKHGFMGEVMKRYVLIVLLSLVDAGPAAASAVSCYSATDGIGAAPLAKGSSLLDMRFNEVAPGNAVAAPTVNVLTGIADGWEVGIGTSLNFSALGDPSNRTSVETVYPWVKAALPFATERIKSGVAVGTLIPGYNAAASTEWQPGISGLVDIALGPVTGNVNLGYARGADSGTNWATGNLNFLLPVGPLGLYEEQFVNYPLSAYANGGVRVSLTYQLTDKVVVDLTPAALWTNTGAGVTWSFNPNLGLGWAF